MSARTCMALAAAAALELAATCQTALSEPLITGRVFDAEDGTAVGGSTWRAWKVDNLGCAGSPRWRDEPLRTLRPDGFFGDLDRPGLDCYDDWVVAIEVEVPDALGPGGRSGYVALTRHDLCPWTTNFPASKLVPLPRPTASVEGVDVRVSWDQPSQWGMAIGQGQGLAGYAVLRSPAGADDFVEVARVVDPAATEWLDRNVPFGAWTYAMQAIFAGPVDGQHLSRRSPLALVWALELRIEARVTELGPAGAPTACGPRTVPALSSFLRTPCDAPGPECSSPPVLPATRTAVLVPDVGSPDLVLPDEGSASAEPGVLTLYGLNGCDSDLLVRRAGNDLNFDAR